MAHTLPRDETRPALFHEAMFVACHQENALSTVLEGCSHRQPFPRPCPSTALLKRYVDLLEHDAERLPIIAIETATSAVPLNDFTFPERCAIMVGSEGNGIDPRICKLLRPGYDAFVIIPMVGPHKSMNVATALGVALYEYRRQWPEGMRG